MQRLQEPATVYSQWLNLTLIASVVLCHVINVNARIKITSHVDVRCVLKCVLLDQARHCVYFAL